MAKDRDGEEKPDNMSAGRRRAAAFLLSLDSDASAQLLGVMSEREIHMLTEEMSRVGELSYDEIDKVWDEFSQEAGAEVLSAEPMLQAILERALGVERAREMLERIRRQSRDMEPFRALRNLDARQIDTVLRGEHPQVLAIVLSYLDPMISYDILRNLSDKERYEVIRRISTTAEMPRELVRQIDEILEVRAYSLASQGSGEIGENRFKTVAQMLNIADPSISKNIMDKLAKDLPEEAEQIQGLMFVFEDLVKIGAREMQKVLGEMDKADLALALKAAPQDVVDHILNNLSSRARDNINDEIEMMGPKPLSEVEDAQKRILESIRAMEEKGEISIQRGAEERMV
jgi:flagellar motor switch protein FliG